MMKFETIYHKLNLNLFKLDSNNKNDEFVKIVMRQTDV